MLVNSVRRETLCDSTRGQVFGEDLLVGLFFFSGVSSGMEDWGSGEWALRLYPHPSHKEKEEHRGYRTGPRSLGKGLG